jgi:hypothetical protein
MVAAITDIGAYHFEAGARSFAAWCEKMVAEDLGDWVRPCLGRLFPYVAHVVETYEALAKARPELASPPARQPTGEERRLMSLCGAESLEDLELALSSPLIEEWLARQKPEDRQALEDWRHQLEAEEAALKDGWSAGRTLTPLGRTPIGTLSKLSEPWSEEKKERMLLQLKENLENEERERQERLKEALPSSHLDSHPPVRPTVEERRLMVLCGMKSLEELEQVMSSPLSEEWLAQQNQADRDALEDWYDRTQHEESGD